MGNIESWSSVARSFDWRCGCGGCGFADSTMGKRASPVRMQGMLDRVLGVKLILVTMRRHPASREGAGD
jgi:hypothetical protein